MSLLKKLFTFGRAVKAELEEEFTDAQAVRLLEQHIREAKQAMQEAGHSRVELAARKKLCEQKVNQLDGDVQKYEGYAMAALNKGDESLAAEVAEKIAKLESEREEENTQLANVRREFDRIEATISKAKQQLTDLERQLAQVKATEAVQKAQEKISATAGATSSKVASAADSLARLKQRQAERQAKLDAAEELSQDASELDKKLKAAGIGSSSKSAEDVLARLKQKG